MKLYNLQPYYHQCILVIPKATPPKDRLEKRLQVEPSEGVLWWGPTCVLILEAPPEPHIEVPHTLSSRHSGRSSKQAPLLHPAKHPTLAQMRIALHSATVARHRGLHFLPPSELVHIVKHRGPTVTADHIQSKGRF